MDLDEILKNSFLNEFNEKEKKKIQSSQEDREIARRKRKQLEPIRTLLQKIVDMEVMVFNKDSRSKITRHLAEPQKFIFDEEDSSKIWAPGISITFNHPAEVEIAIPNRPEQDGCVVMKVASHHPDAYILEEQFYNMENACKALAYFLSKNTVSIGKQKTNTNSKEEENLTKENKIKNSNDFFEDE